MIKVTAELHNALIDKFEQRATAGDYNGKAKMKAQLEFLIGAYSAIDTLNGDDPSKTCLPPIVWISALRGDLVKKIEVKPIDIDTVS